MQWGKVLPVVMSNLSNRSIGCSVSFRFQINNNFLVHIPCNILGISILQDYLLFTWTSALNWAFCTLFVDLCLLPDMFVPLSMRGGCFCLCSSSHWDLLISLIGQNEQLFLCHSWLTGMTGFPFGFYYLDPRVKSSLPFPLPRESPWAGLLMGQRLGTLPLS